MKQEKWRGVLSASAYKRGVLARLHGRRADRRGKRGGEPCSTKSALIKLLIFGNTIFNLFHFFIRNTFSAEIIIRSVASVISLFAV